MLLFLVMSIVLEQAVANGFFNGCPIDRRQRIDNDSVFDVLHTFYKDLSFVQASTELGEDPNFDRILEEARSLVRGPQWQHVRNGIDLLGRGDLDLATTIIRAAAHATPHSVPHSLVSYINYFTAELYRRAGSIGNALLTITEVTHGRRISKGISLNELERLEGLILIQRVLKFNQGVDKVYGFSRDQSYAGLKEVHSGLKGKMDALSDMKAMEFRRVLESNSRIFHALKRREIGEPRSSRTPWTAVLEMLDHREIIPAQDSMNVRSVAKNYAEDILCEFGRKLAILVPNSRDDRGTDYSSLIGQLREIDADRAEEFERIVVPNIADEIRRDVAINYLVLFDNRSAFLTTPDDIFDTLKTYAYYFGAESFRYRNDCGGIVTAERILDEIKIIRQSKPGVSLDKLFELEGRIMIKLIKCFRGRLISVYRLNGSESEQELGAKRAQFGGCDSYFPRP